MPYIFGALLMLNIVVMTYFMIQKTPGETNSILQAKQQLSQPVNFINHTSHLPPVIGKKE